MKLGLCSIFILIFLTACPKKEILEHKPFLKGYMIYSCEFGFKRNFLLLTRYDQDLDSLVLKDAMGRRLKLYNPDLEPDSCPYLWDMSKKMLMISQNIKGKNYTCMFGRDGVISYQNPYCSKQENLADMDSFPCKYMVFELKLDTIKVELNIWKSIDSIAWTRDSTPWRTIGLNDICSKEEIEEDKKFMQQLYQKYAKIEINPNPFVDEFTFRLSMEKMSWSLSNRTIAVKFMDDAGKVYLEQTIVYDTIYTFSLPDFPKGKIVFYTLSWDDYMLSGQFMKSQ